MGAAEKQVLLSTTLGCVADFQNGGAWKEGEYVDSGVPVTRVTNCQSGTVDLRECKYLSFSSAKKYERHRLIKDDLIVATVGSHPTQPGSVVGRTSAVPESASGSLLNQNAVRLRAKAGLLDQRYLIYLASSQEFRNYIIAHARGAASQVRMSIELLRDMPLLLPTLATQQLVASFLGAYDDLIENNTRRIEILEEMARRLYEEWFVQFRFPGHEEGEFKETELGLIPQGWQLLRLGDCVELAYGKALKAQDRVPGDYPVYGSSGVVGTHCESLVDGPGIIVGRKGNVGSVFWSDVSFFPIDTTYYVRSDVPLSYLYFNLQSQRFLNNDAAVPGLNREQAYALPFLLPDKDLLSRFSSEWESFYGLLRRLGRANVNLRAQRDLLLPKLISGEIDVSDIPMPT